MSKEIEKSESIENEEDQEQKEHPSASKSSKPVIIDANAYKTIILYASSTSKRMEGNLWNPYWLC